MTTLPFRAPFLPPAYLVDLDGTMCLMGDRSPYDETCVINDRPNTAVVETVQSLYDAGNHIIFMSGRSENCRDQTEQWLTKYFAPTLDGHPRTWDGLHMRTAGDTRKDSIIKQELYEKHINGQYHIIAAFDDRDQVVDLWRSLGLTCYQVAPGDF